MDRFLRKLTAGVMLTAAGFIGSEALAIGWPANYYGVMLQGFYWDSYSAGKGYGTTKWTDLTNSADELSQYFDLIWVPNSGKSTGGNGYMPIYWFSNHNSDFGTEAQLKTMISTYKAKGVGIIEDVVINHRAGVSNWYNFPRETWNGKTYEMKDKSICSTDEGFNKDASKANIPANYKGNPDTGEDFDGARDLDHTNTTVQDHCKNYCKFLLDELGYVGFRLDMVKGYKGEYTKIYNQYSKPRFCVGEYWDGQYDAVAAWIESTGRESAAFDFPCKYQINKALGGGENLTELVWTNPSGAGQPAGMIHHGYNQLAVTFVDNHDTFRDGSKFTGNVLAANAFILMSPGTPCVFWPHYYSNKNAIQNLIKARKAVGIHNMSAVTVLRSEKNLYVAEVTGTKGKAIVKIGSGSYSAPSGYTKYTSGNGYEVWTNTGQSGNDDNNGNEKFNLPEINGVYLKNTASWPQPYVWAWNDTEDCVEAEWPGEKMTKTGDYWKWEVPKGKSTPTGILFNGGGNGDDTKTADLTYVRNGVYDCNGTLLGKAGSGGGNDDITDMPANFYVIGEVEGNSWDPTIGAKMRKEGSLFIGTLNVTGTEKGYFSFAKSLASTWDELNVSGNRYAPDVDIELVKDGAKVDLVEAPADAKAYYIANGKYDIVADWKTKKVYVATAGSISSVEKFEAELENIDSTPVYFNLQGVMVSEPLTPGIYIRVRGTKSDKIMVK